MTTLNVDECAAKLKCSACQVKRLARKKLLPGCKVGRAWVFVDQDITHWLQARVKANLREPSKRGRPARKPIENWQPSSPEFLRKVGI